MLQTLNFTAGGRQANAKASFFRYESCISNGADEAVRVRADGNDLGLFLPGDFVSLPAFATSWEVTPISSTATGTFRLGVGVVGSSRLTGVVRVVDQAYEKTLQGAQFIAALTIPVNVTKASFLGIKATTKPVKLGTFAIGSATAGPVTIFTTPGDPNAPTTPTVSPLCFSKKTMTVGGVSARVYATPTFATVDVTTDFLPGGANVWLPSIAAGGSISMNADPPIVIPAGWVLGVHSMAFNRDLSLYAEIEEL